ncbi:MAG TPA: HNH endonuclease [Ktedonobacteraceae bacterium]|nr:HNH endonuclease [Ktedonobacteraceae bacterium]
MVNIDGISDEQIAFIVREHTRVQQQLFRARSADLPATLTFRQWIAILEQHQGLCAFCKKKPFEAMEHLLPVYIGGGTTAENCVPTCQSCNSRKSRSTARMNVETSTYELTFEPPTKPEVESLFVPLDQAAELLGCSLDALTKRVQRGKIVTHQLGGKGKHLILKSDLIGLLAQSRPAEEHQST